MAKYNKRKLSEQVLLILFISRYVQLCPQTHKILAASRLQPLLRFSESVKAARAGCGVYADGDAAQNGAESNLAGHVPAAAEGGPAGVHSVRKKDVFQRAERGTAACRTAGLS